MHVATNSNQYVVIDNITINSTINTLVKDHVYVDDKDAIYATTNTNDTTPIIIKIVLLSWYLLFNLFTIELLDIPKPFELLFDDGEK